VGVVPPVQLEEEVGVAGWTAGEEVGLEEEAQELEGVELLLPLY
jgi:hypothetical protein